MKNLKNYEKLSKIFKALGSPLRLRIISTLIKDACNVNSIVKELGVPQSTISQNLSILKNSGIIASTRTGTKICYKIASKDALNILESIKNKL